MSCAGVEASETVGDGELSSALGSHNERRQVGQVELEVWYSTQDLRHVLNGQQLKVRVSGCIGEFQQNN